MPERDNLINVDSPASEYRVTVWMGSNLKHKRTFCAQVALSEARTGELKGALLRKAIKTAEELGMIEVARELKVHAAPRARKTPAAAVAAAK